VVAALVTASDAGAGVGFGVVGVGVVGAGVVGAGVVGAGVGAGAGATWPLQYTQAAPPQEAACNNFKSPISMPFFFIVSTNTENSALLWFVTFPRLSIVGRILSAP